MLGKLLELEPAINLSYLMLDFERAAINSFEESFATPLAKIDLVFSSENSFALSFIRLYPLRIQFAAHRAMFITVLNIFDTIRFDNN